MVIVSMDCETGELHDDLYQLNLDATGKKFLCGVITQENYTYKLFDKKEDMWNALIEQSTKLWKNKECLNVYAHNMKYDLFNIMPRPNKIKFFSIDPFIAEYTTKNFKIMFLDSYAIFRMALKDVAPLVDMKKYDTPLKVASKQDVYLIEYMINDSKIVMKSILKIKDILKENDVNIKRLYTINQISIQYLLKKMKEIEDTDWFFYNKEKNEVHFTKFKQIIHDAYRGGRTEAFKIGHYEDVTYVDVNNLYGYSAMNIPIPDLRTEMHINYPLNILNINELLKFTGVSKCLIYNRNDDIGLLPVRMITFNHYPKKGSLFLGTYTHIELEYALKNGYEILDIEKSVIYELNVKNPFIDVINGIYPKRAESPLNNYVFKSIMNSMFGKLAQKRIPTEMIFDDINTAIEYIKKGYDMVNGSRNEADVLFRKKIDEEKPKKYFVPIIPCYVNAKAKIIMHEHMKKIGIKDLIYTDTDSIIYTGNHHVDIGNEIGKFKLVKNNTDCVIYGPKMKRVGDDITVSGISKKDLNILNFELGDISYTQMMSLNDGLEYAGFFKTLTRNLHDDSDKFKMLSTELENKRFFIDSNIKYMDFFKDKIMEFCKTLDK